MAEREVGNLTETQLRRLIRQIDEGKADKSLGEIRDAIESRQRELRKKVEDLVHEVFGDEYSVTPTNRFIAQAERDQHGGGSPHPDSVSPPQPVDLDQVKQSLAQTERERIAEETGEIVSNSPIIT